MIIRKIEGHDRYYVAEDGTILKAMKPWKTSTGYDHVKLDRKHYDVHRIVAKHFLEQKEGCVVNHIDHDRNNNHYSNLEWVTQRENIQKYIENGGTPIKNFIECTLLYEDKIVKQCRSIEEASKLAEEMGASYSMIKKHREHGEFKIVIR